MKKLIVLIALLVLPGCFEVNHLGAKKEQMKTEVVER